MKSLIFISVIIFSNVVFGHKSPVDTKVVVPGVKRNLQSQGEIEEGWSQTLKIGTNVSLGRSDHWIGQTNGGSTTLGLSFDGHLNYKGKRNEWRSVLRVLEASTKNPRFPRHVKSSDEITIEGIYLRSLEKYYWIGPYVRVKVQTSLFKEEDIRSESYTYRTLDPSGTVVHSKTTNTFRLTDGLRPINFKESAGFFVEPYEMEKVTVEFRLGMGAVQVIADHQFSIDSVDLVDRIIEVTQLESYHQMGVEFALSVEGQIGGKSSYESGYEILIPFSFQHPSFDGNHLNDRDAFEWANHDFFAKLSTKLYKYISLSCEYRLRKQPLLLDKTQAQSLALVNFTYTLF